MLIDFEGGFGKVHNLLSQAKMYCFVRIFKALARSKNN